MTQKFDGVQDTLFIPLTARIKVSKQFPEFFYDEKALSLETKLPSVNSKSEFFHMAIASRYFCIDKIVRKFCSQYDSCNIICLGAGLETMAWRIDTNAHFYEVDFEEVIKTREAVLQQKENESFICSDILDLSWISNIDKKTPALFVATGVFQYIKESEVLSLIDGLKREFDSAEIVFDATNTMGLKIAQKMVERSGNKGAPMYFAVDNPIDFCSKAHIELIECRGVYKEALQMLAKKLTFVSKISMWVAEILGNVKIIHARLTGGKNEGK